MVAGSLNVKCICMGGGGGGEHERLVKGVRVEAGHFYREDIWRGSVGIDVEGDRVGVGVGATEEVKWIQ